MTHILDTQDISRLQQVFVGANLLERPFTDGVWDFHTKRAYEGWCLSHGVLTLAAKIQPQSLEAMPLPLRKAFLEQDTTNPVKPTETPEPIVEPVVAATPPVVDAPVAPPVVEPVEQPAETATVETTPVEATNADATPAETTPVDATTEPATEEVATEEKRNLNFKNRNR